VSEDGIISRVPANLLFRHRFGCPQVDLTWPDNSKPTKKKVAKKKTAKKATSKSKAVDRKMTCQLDDSCALPHFGRFEDQRNYADIRCAWNEQGLFFDVQVQTKTQSTWCRASQILESDCVMIWIDTRSTQSIHRASRFCHWFLFMPEGGGPDDKSPMATMLKINRAKEDPKTFQMFRPCIDAQSTHDGYRMTFFITEKCLTGWDNGEHRQIGFNYLIKDRELDNQSLAVGDDFPIYSDPSLWHVMELNKQQ